MILNRERERKKTGDGKIAFLYGLSIINRLHECASENAVSVKVHHEYVFY